MGSRPASHQDGAHHASPPVRSWLRQGLLPALAVQLLQLALLGGLVGLACWPLNLMDRAQGRLLASLPAFGGGWGPTSLALMLAPLAAMPLFHIHGIVASLLAPLVAGGSVICCRSNAPHALLAAMQHLEPSWLSAGPTLLQGLLAELDRTHQPTPAPPQSPSASPAPPRAT
jgi:acyl-CoA synthetase (AMP-forming)/AMP-acid ligase II